MESAAEDIARRRHTGGHVGVAVDLQRGHRLRGVALGRVLPVVAGESGDGGDAIGAVTAHAMRHEAAVGVADEEDALLVDGVVRLDVVDDRVQVGDVVDGGTVHVAAGVGGVPEAVARRVDGAVGIGDVDLSTVGEVVKVEEAACSWPVMP